MSTYRMIDAVWQTLRSERVHAQLATLLFGVWCGYLAARYGAWNSAALPWRAHAVSFAALVGLGWLVRREDRAAREA